MHRPLGTILVTGGAGFIGSALVWALNQRGIDDIIVCDLLGSDEKWRNLVGLRFRDYIDGNDLRKRIQNSTTTPRCRTVFHLGACSSTTERDAGYLLDNNYSYSKELASWAIEHDSRFIYASSAATYGADADQPDDAHNVLHRLRPLNAYGYSKHLFDVHAQREGWLRRIIGLKYFNVFGPNEDHKGDMRSLVHKAHRQVLETGRLQLFRSHRPEFRDGEQKRDFLYVKDAVEMTLHFAFAEAPTGGLYNLGSGSSHTWIEVAEALFAAMERPPAIDFIDMPASLRDRYQYFTQAKIDKLRQSGYTRPITPLRDAIADYVRNYLANGSRLESTAPATAPLL